jgi:ribosome-associated translation inhibitor RaiA
MTTQITFRDFPPSEAVRDHVERRAAKLLERASASTVRVTLGAPHRHHQHGHAYRVCIDLVVPGHTLVVSPRDGAPGHADLHAAIDDAFDDADRQLREWVRERREAARV